MAPSGMTLPGVGFGFAAGLPLEPSMKYPPAPPSTSTTAATMMSSFFFDFFLGAASPAVSFDMVSLSCFGWSVGRCGQEGAFLGWQARQHDDVHPAVHGHRARVARRDQRAGTGEPGRGGPGAPHAVGRQGADDGTCPGGGPVPPAGGGHPRGLPMV